MRTVLAVQRRVPAPGQAHAAHRLAPAQLLNGLHRRRCFAPVSYTHLDVYKRQAGAQHTGKHHAHGVQPVAGKSPDELEITVSDKKTAAHEAQLAL